MDFSGTKKKISVAIVGDVSSKYLSFGVNALEMLDSSRFFIDLKILNFEDAKNLLRRGKISAFAVVSDDFFESVMDGSNNLKLTYYTNSGQEGIESIVKNEVAKIVTNLLVHAQAGIFAMEKIARITGQTKNLSEYNYDLNMKYVKWALDRTKFCRVEETGFSSGLSLSSYYLLAALLFLSAFFGISAFPFFMNGTKIRRRFFAINGIPPATQVLCEFFAYFCLHLIVFLFFFVFAAIFLNLFQFKIEIWRYSGVTDGLISLFVRFIPVCLMISSLQFFLFEFSENIISSMCLQFLIMTSLCFLGGCFYPMDFFPEILKNISSFLPVGSSFLFLRSSFSFDSFCSPMIQILYFFVFLGLSVCIRILKIRSE